jgi:hypothetical protein
MVWKKKTHLLVLNLSVDEQKSRGWRKQPAKSPLPSVKPPPASVGITAPVPVVEECGYIFLFYDLGLQHNIFISKP